MSKDKRGLSRLLHDFKSPLSSTKIAIEFILEGRAGSISKRTEELLKDIRNRTKELINNIQEFEDNNG